jgi:hypothetical protein
MPQGCPLPLQLSKLPKPAGKLTGKGLTWVHAGAADESLGLPRPPPAATAAAAGGRSGGRRRRRARGRRGGSCRHAAGAGPHGTRACPHGAPAGHVVCICIRRVVVAAPVAAIHLCRGLPRQQAPADGAPCQAHGRGGGVRRGGAHVARLPHDLGSAIDGGGIVVAAAAALVGCGQRVGAHTPASHRAEGGGQRTSEAWPAIGPSVQTWQLQNGHKQTAGTDNQHAPTPSRARTWLPRKAAGRGPASHRPSAGTPARHLHCPLPHPRCLPPPRSLHPSLQR